MKFFQCLTIICMILSIVAGTFIIPAAAAVYLHELAVLPAFCIPAGVLWAITLALFLKTKRSPIRLTTREGILLVCFAWIGAGLLGAVPFMLSGYVPHFSDAIFESVSGFTTTGASALENIESYPMALRVWRTQMHWLGGMGIVALTVALFPLLGVGGFQLIKSETSGPDKGKVTAKITHTAKALWFIYLGMTILQILLLCVAGMPFLEAMCHSFSTLGTGGFSTQNTSIGYYQSSAIEIICTVFMLLAGGNFSLYFHLFTGNPEEFFRNSELRAYLRIVFAAAIGIALVLIPIYGAAAAFRHSFFHVASIITTTGFSTVNYCTWPPFAQALLFLLMFTGGCSGSTAGGIKVIRWVILRKQAYNEMQRLIHPHGVFSIQLNRRPGRKDVVYSVAGFLFVYCICLLISFLAATLSGQDILTSITAALTLVGNIGAAFGRIGSGGDFSFFPHWAKILFSFSMLAGRLELYTIVILCVPAFWRR
ncbi:TrkH family potassium uptake protein [Treponema sp.]|uniref:TrkH family potassium uptake protein n=1 Tax=Treponema sp. TaxID=166 RepID=UPI003FA2F3D5